MSNNNTQFIVITSQLDSVTGGLGWPKWVKDTANKVKDKAGDALDTGRQALETGRRIADDVIRGSHPRAPFYKVY